MTRSWFRRNGVALLVLAVLLPVTAVAIGWREWTATYDAPTRRTQAVTPDGGDTVELAGATWGPVTSGVFTAADGLPVPEGAKVIAVKVPVDVHDVEAGVGCTAPLLVEQSSGREWSEMSVALELEYDPDAPVTCDSTATEAYEMLVPYIVPEDAEGPFWVDVVPYVSAPVFARFSIDP